MCIRDSPQIGQEPAPGVAGLTGRRAQPDEHRLAVGVDAPAGQHRLDDVTLDYLFLDASHFRYHANAAAEPVLAGWGIDTDGQPVFVGLGPAASESGDAWGGFLTDLGARGLRCPLLVISDGATGLISAVERTMSGALRQRCLIHRTRKESTCWCRCASLCAAG